MTLNLDNPSYIPKDQRKTILLLCDDIRLHSGIATMAREIVVGTAQHYNWFNLGGGLHHPDAGKTFDLSQSINDAMSISDANVFVRPNNGYGEPSQLRALLKEVQPDAIMIFTDPRYWDWLFNMEREIRANIPLIYLNIWDDYPTPIYNKSYYESCDTLMSISKQTKVINEIVLGDLVKDKVLTYVPHGINEIDFHPIQDKEHIRGFAGSIEGWDNPEFTVFWNARNIRRKSPGDVILAYRMFCDMIGKEKAAKCRLLLHTQPVDENGTNLIAVREAFCDPSYVKVSFSTNRLAPQHMNMLYNLADVTMLISSNEGWGLSLTESMMAGTMIIGNVTGGMQDQMRFENSKGEWIEFDKDFPSNHRKTVEKCGEWAVPVFPSNISCVGSVPTPYIFDDRCEPVDVAKAILEVYNLPKEERERRGLKGREWVTSPESGMSAKNMCKNVVKSIDTTFENWKPVPQFDFCKVEEEKPEYIQHRLFDYIYKNK